MQKIKLFLAVLITLILSAVLIIFFDHTNILAKSVPPKELFQVYLDGEKIGVIDSKEKLEKYINDKQEDIKAKYGVDKVYPPNNLYIQKYVGYEEKVSSESDIYDLIKEKSPFTIKGYVVDIKKEQPIKINIINKEIFKKAAAMTIKAYVPQDNYQLFLTDKQPEIKTTGRKIENIYIEEDITIREAYLPVDEFIFMDEKTLAKYLLFGTLEEQKKYVVKPGDTIENIAFDNKLGVEEFLLVNPQFNNPNNLLYSGQEVMVGLINPIFSVVVEEHVVEDKTRIFKTQISYDKALSYGTSYVKQEGSDGLERVTQKIKSVNGDIVSGYIASTEVLKYEVNKIIIKGSKSSSGNVIVTSSSGWVWPTKTPYIITSSFGYRWGELHDALDISGTGHGSPIYAANSGVVVLAANHWSYGLHIVIQHADNYHTLYAHLSKIYVTKGQTVKAGTTIGAMGNTGHSTGTHLHFGTYIGFPDKPGSRPFNPLMLYK